MADQSAVPDYELDDRLELTKPEQHRALFDDTRAVIVQLLLERAATTSDLAAALGKPKGTVGHHLKVLEHAGLVRVVRTKKVRAIEAKYYGRTARVFIYHRVGEGKAEPQRSIATAADEIAAVPYGSDLPFQGGVRYARIPAERAEEWRRRVEELIDDFVREPRGGETTYGLVAAVFPTGRRSLPDPEP
jgi:DNA-binding transcriptional ArsR family regulator